MRAGTLSRWALEQRENELIAPPCFASQMGRKFIEVCNCIFCRQWAIVGAARDLTAHFEANFAPSPRCDQLFICDSNLATKRLVLNQYLPCDKKLSHQIHLAVLQVPCPHCKAYACH